MLALGGCVTKVAPRVSVPEKFPYRIFAVYEGWHTSLLIDASAIRPYLPSLQAELEGQAFVRFGWGDGDYFTGKNKTAGAAARALFVSRYSAIQVLTYQRAPLAAIAADQRAPLALDRRGLRNLAAYIEASLLRDAAGTPVALPAYEANTGHFYRAQVHYSLFSNCNTWSGRALQAAGFPIKSRLHLTAQSVFKQAREMSRRQYNQGLLSAADLAP